MAGNLFTAAKAKGASASGSKSAKEEVVITDASFHSDLARLAELNVQMDQLGAEATMLAANVKERSKKEFVRLYETNGKFPGSFNIRATGARATKDATLMFIPTDKYLKIGEERFKQLAETYGASIVTEKTTFTMNAELIEKYGEVISQLITDCRDIPDVDKPKLISATTAYEVTKGTIKDLVRYTDISPINVLVEDTSPIFQTKNVTLEGLNDTEEEKK